MLRSFHAWFFSPKKIALGTVGNVHEAVQWLSYSYLFVRMRRNPLHYGVPYEELYGLE